MQDEMKVKEAEDVKSLHIKKYIQYCQQLGNEKSIHIKCKYIKGYGVITKNTKYLHYWYYNCKIIQNIQIKKRRIL
jgi:hypothetical protein